MCKESNYSFSPIFGIQTGDRLWQNYEALFMEKTCKHNKNMLLEDAKYAKPLV